MLSTLLLVLAAAPISPARPSAARISADGRVVTAGIRFRLPPQSRYRVHDAGGAPAYVAEANDGSAVVLVMPAISDAPMPCAPKQRGAVVVNRDRTRRGLDACLVVGAAPDGPAAMVILFVKNGDGLAVITAIGSAERAERLAGTVGDSVEIDPRVARSGALPVFDVPKPEPRLVGCFEQELHAFASRSFAAGGTTRCFAEDLTFTERSAVGVSTTFTDASGDRIGDGTALQEDDAARRGTWIYEDGVLALTYEDGSEGEWTMTLGDATQPVLANGRLWVRR